ETSWRVGYVAVGKSRKVAARRFLTTPSAHASGLIPAVEEVVREVGIGPGDLAGVVVGAGPGSFTGVRIGGAAAKGLATSLGIPLYATSSLRAASFALEALGPGVTLPPEMIAGDGPPGWWARPGALTGDGRELRHVLLDARRGRVYGAGYDAGTDGPIEVAAPHAGTILDVINARLPLDTVFMGDGAIAHAALLRAAGYAVRPFPAGIPVADAVVRCCSWRPVDAAAWEPQYVREWRPG
ncbi:MAG: tRNA (adenosine(37)-N6)-threonylcarbamoyltransferase complex dimerization subunit type 1 TsaB, partial [Gemmatimonadetes bacterium]|nr:tRNA (adenosine(37)-N6)-threonylcarbamoyltransferase complex dimerization subunit type 1 TsaB [Gemmatimonadota bacterium]